MNVALESEKVLVASIFSKKEEAVSAAVRESWGRGTRAEGESVRQSSGRGGGTHGRTVLRTHLTFTVLTLK